MWAVVAGRGKRGRGEEGRCAWVTAMDFRVGGTTLLLSVHEVPHHAALRVTALDPIKVMTGDDRVAVLRNQ